mmetsp:Transcript_129449/g.224804  ORF Transcript_129449/g.224804 Transcript_129449/m.224804 type:complete len:227 (-) Transcript_129449:116-796(-)
MTHAVRCFSNLLLRFRVAHAIALSSIVHALAGTFCWKKGACSNMQNGTWEKPILTGSQKHVDDDGYCAYGHGGAETQCRPEGLECGYTFHNCRCFSKDESQVGAENDSRTKLIAGVVISLLGAAALLGILGYFYGPSKSPGVVPYNERGVGSKGSKNAGTAFSDISRPGAAASTQRPAPPDKMDGCGLAFAVIPALAILGGIVLIFISRSEASKVSYYNECETAAR